MLTPCRLVLLVAASFAAVGYGDDIIIPLVDGNIVLSPQFIRVNEYGRYVPELSFSIRNETSSPWRSISLQFEIGGLCNGEPRQWSVPVTTSAGWIDGYPAVSEYTETVPSLVGKVDGCTAEIIKPILVSAVSLDSKTQIKGILGEAVEFRTQLLEIKAKRVAEAAKQAEEERRAAAEDAKRKAVALERQKRLAAERRRKDVEENVRLAKIRAEQDSIAAAERAKIRAACTLIYKNTIDKKISDLTVRQEQQVRACQAVGLYPPQ